MSNSHASRLAPSGEKNAPDGLRRAAKIETSQIVNMTNLGTDTTKGPKELFSPW